MTGIVAAAWARPALAAVTALVVAQWLVLAWQAKPFADDFCIMQTVRDYGYWDAQRHWWDSISGRFTGNAVITGIGVLADRLVGDLWIASSAFYTAIVAGFWVLGWRFVGAVLPGLPAADRLIAANLATIVLVVAMPRSADVLFWVTGAAMNALTVFWLAPAAFALVRVARHGRRPSMAAVGLYAATAPLAAGLHEVVFPLLAIIVTAIAWISIRLRLGRRAVIGAAAVLALGAAGFALLYLAPGNARRIAIFGRGGSLLAMPFGGLAYFGIFVVLRIIAMPVLLGWLGLAILWSARTLPPSSTGDRRAAPVLVLPVVFALCGWAVFSIGYYGMGADIPHRTKDIVFIVGFITLTAAALAAGQDGRVRGWLARRPRRRLLPVAAVLLIITNFNLYRAPYTMLVSGPRFDAEVRAQAAAVVAGPGDIPRVPRIETRPRLLFLGDLPADPSNWHNVCLGRYFGRQSVVPG